jgi:hypothetical protein
MRAKHDRSSARVPIILRLGPRDYAVAIWREDEGGEAVYEIIHRDIREVIVAATLARKARA